MKTLGLILAMALASSLPAAASVWLLAPGLTPTPLVPSIVTSGQVVTARFGVASDLPPAYWAIGISALTDGIPSGGWDWVVDEQGAYGLTKSMMVAGRCPTPGVLVDPYLPYLNPVEVPFVVPFYGPAPVTMSFQVLVRQGAISYCNGNAILCKAVVINPGSTWTTTKTVTPTRTPTPSLTPSQSPGGPTPTSTPTTVPSPVPTAAPTVGPTTGITPTVKIKAAVAVPNPGPKNIRFYVEGVADRVKVGFWSYGWTKVGELVVEGPLTGWNEAPVWNMGHGVFIAKASSWVGGTETSNKFATFYLW